jgi:Peptidase inhibitor family I36
MRSLLRLALLLPVVLLSACENRLEILGPTPGGEGIAIFIHADFAGSSQAINTDVRDLGHVEGPCSTGAEGEQPTWHDCISSVRVQAGWTVTLYRDKDFKGRSMTLTADAPNLRELPGPCDGSFNDCVSSLRVARL